MNNQAVLYGIIGLLLGVVITGFVASNIVNTNNTGMMRSEAWEKGEENMHMMMGEGMSMGEMVTSLQDKTGDDFDKAFILGMIEHHQGAIDMANLAKQSAKHDEIKRMADDIISAQSNEIEQMKIYQSCRNKKTVEITLQVLPSLKNVG